MHRLMLLFMFCNAASVSVDLSRNFGTKANFSSDFLKNRNNSQINNFNAPNWKCCFKLIKAHSRIKIDATNLTNKYYYTGFGCPAIGGVYNITFAHNVF